MKVTRLEKDKRTMDVDALNCLPREIATTIAVTIIPRATNGMDQINIHEALSRERS